VFLQTNNKKYKNSKGHKPAKADPVSYYKAKRTNCKKETGLYDKPAR